MGSAGRRGGCRHAAAVEGARRITSLRRTPLARPHEQGSQAAPKPRISLRNLCAFAPFSPLRLCASAAHPLRFAPLLLRSFPNDRPPPAGARFAPGLSTARRLRTLMSRSGRSGPPTGPAQRLRSLCFVPDSASLRLCCGNHPPRLCRLPPFPNRRPRRRRRTAHPGSRPPAPRGTLPACPHARS